MKLAVRKVSGRGMSIGLLGLSLTIAATAIVQGYGASRSQRATQQRLINDFGAFASWSFRQHLDVALLAAYRATLAPAVHADDGTPAGTILPAALLARDAREHEIRRQPSQAACEQGCGAPYYLRIPVKNERVMEAGSIPPHSVVEAIASRLRLLATSSSRFQGDVSAVLDTTNNVERLVVFATVEAPDGLVIYAFEVDPARYVRLFRDVAAHRALLPATLTRGRSADEIVAVEVRSPRGALWYESDEAPDFSSVAADTLAPRVGQLRTRAVVRPAAIGSLVGSDIGQPRLPMLWGFLALAIGMAMVAFRQLRREDELTRLRADFVASVSHELRTPLTQIQLFIDTLRLGRHRTDEQRAWILDNMQRETTRLTNLVENVLEHSRAEHATPIGALVPVSLNELLPDIVHSFEPLAATRQATLEFTTDDDLVVEAHAASFRQVMLNLLDNAVKYGPLGQRVCIAARESGDMVRITIDDEGPGVALEEREAIWLPFRRGPAAIGSVAVGSGIGLSVVRHIVRQHHGTADVESAPTGGARFVVRLPRSMQHVASSVKQSMDTRGPTVAT